jgi:nucleoside-diphosphate-sugar epimerase
LVPAASGGSVEADVPRPVGEYAMTVLGRERMFEYFAREFGMPVALLRLNYATELRYGVLVDLARKVLRQEPIDLSMGHVNVIWQRDANAMAIEALGQATNPPLVLNIAGPEMLRVQHVVEEFGSLLGRTVNFEGREASDALLSNATKSYGLFGRPAVSVAQVIRWTADWVQRGGESLGKPTHFESRDGTF